VLLCFDFKNVAFVSLPSFSHDFSFVLIFLQELILLALLAHLLIAHIPQLVQLKLPVLTQYQQDQVPTTTKCAPCWLKKSKIHRSKTHSPANNS
jgi:hypothetical protein